MRLVKIPKRYRKQIAKQWFENNERQREQLAIDNAHREAELVRYKAAKPELRKNTRS